MKYAPTVLATEPVNGLTCGIDWARDDHAVAIVDSRGREIHRSTVENTAAGLRTLLTLLRDSGVGEVAIERPDGPIVDALLTADATVVVISPNQLKNLRGRYGSAGNKDDRFDAFVLADTLRTDRSRLRPLVPDSAATTALRTACRARKDLIGHRVALANQLREHLNRVFPGAVGLFANLDSTISLTFLTRFDRQDRADWLTPKRLASWLASVGYTGGMDPPEALSCLAGVAPSTRQSGTMRTVAFRWSCDKHLREAIIDFAADSRHANPWAADLYKRARANKHDHTHATRILARAWLFVIWHCWQDGVAYDPTQHRALQTLLNNQQPAA